VVSNRQSEAEATLQDGAMRRDWAHDAELPRYWNTHVRNLVTIIFIIIPQMGEREGVLGIGIM
jgi:hypothetical protein